MSISVLVVDDQVSFLGIASDLLTARGFDVVGTASDGADAILAAATLTPDAVLLDVHLGADDGIDVLSRLVTLAKPPRVLMTSSDSAAVTQDLAVRNGAVGFVSKADLADADLQGLLTS